MSTNSFSIAPRAEKAAQILKISPQEVLKLLADEGLTDDVSGFSILNSSSTTVEDLAQIFLSHTEAKKIPAKAAAAVLKGSDKISQTEPAAPPSMPVIFTELVKMSRPIQQWEDSQLLEQFAKTRDEEIGQELNKRAKGNKFIVLIPGKYEPGQEVIDKDKSLDLLKVARKRTTPGVIPYGDIFSMVYKVTELNLADRIIEICPICGGTLWQGYCESCQISFQGVNDDARAYVKLVTNSASFNPKSFSDRKAVISSALKGVEDLKVTWPSLAHKFDELKFVNDLPKLRIIENRPSTAVADPFHVDGCRISGNRIF
jgi:hypothetical protein